MTNTATFPTKSMTNSMPMQSTNWLTNPNDWDKDDFVADIVKFIEQTQGSNAYPNLVLIGLLANQIDIYVQCAREMSKTGLVEFYNKGATSGPSLHFSMADKALNRILQLMKELGLTPSHRVGVIKSTKPDALELEELFASA
jgi:phage terminase small subunit